MRRYALDMAPQVTEEKLNNTKIGTQSPLRLRAAADGRIVAAWQAPDASGNGVFAPARGQ